MNCTLVRPLLSAFHDGELVENQRLQVVEHLGRCVECAQELERFEKLSQLASVLPGIATPGTVWQGIRDQLDQDAPSRRPTPRSAFVLTRSRLVSLAAAVLVALGLGTVVFQLGSSREHGAHDQLAADLGQYLDRFEQDPDAAQGFLVATYASKLIEPQQAIHEVGYRPAVALGLPVGYTVDSTYVLTMPCCTCVQSICRRSDGSSFAIFEHSDVEPMSFGGRRETRAICAGKECCLVDLDHRIAASWQRGDRQITLIGGRDRNEINQMIAWLDQVEAHDEESISN